MPSRVLLADAMANRSSLLPPSRRLRSTGVWSWVTREFRTLSRMRLRVADAYFVLDTATGESWEGEYEAWREELHRRGLPEEPALIRPTRELVADRPW